VAAVAKVVEGGAGGEALGVGERQEEAIPALPGRLERGRRRRQERDAGVVAPARLVEAVQRRLERLPTLPAVGGGETKTATKGEAAPRSGLNVGAGDGE
jgi:hypothetical protein